MPEPRNAPRKPKAEKAAPAAVKAAPTARTGDNIRAWAKENGFQVAPMGKLPSHVVEAFDRQRFSKEAG